MSEHSPLPWGRKRGVLRDADGNTVALSAEPRTEQDLDYVVRACNSYYDLLAVMYQRLHEAVTVCRACPLGPARGDGVPGEYRGSEDTRTMAIGEGPGAVEQEKHRPFVGDSGQVLDSLFHDAGLVDYYLTNIAKHRPWVVRGKQQPPDDVTIKACLPFLQAEFKMVRPSKVILLGKTAAKVVLELPGNPGMKDLVNKEFDVPRGVVGMDGVRALVVYHPAHFLHNRTAPWVNKQINDFKRAVKTFRGIEPPRYKVERVLCPTHSS